MSNNDTRKHRILLVEDEALIALSEKKTLEQHGYGVLTVHSGEQAVRTASQEINIDLILMDIDLGSGIDGTEAATQILAKRSLPIVFLTSHAEKEYVSRVKHISNYGYVMKGSGEFVLLESITMALQLFQAHKETAGKEERLSFIVNEAPVGIFRSSSNGVFHYMNQEMAHILGFRSPEQALSHYSDIGTQMYTTEEDRKRFLALIEQEGVVRDFRFEIVRATGERAWLKVSAHRVPDHGGQEIVINGFAIDETERHLADQELKRSRQQYRSMVDLAQEIIVRHDTEGKWIFVNDAACRFFGQPREELIGQHYMDYLHPEDRAEATEALDTMVDTRERVDNVVNRNWTPDGYRIVEWNSSPFTDEHGTFLGHQAVGRDITEQKMAEAKLEEELRSKIEQKEYLIREMNHRIKNNLRVVASLIELKDADLGHAIDLSDLRNQVAAIEKGHEALQDSDEITHINFKHYVDDILATVFNPATSRNVTVENAIPEISLRTDAALPLGLIINETATNALQHGFSRNDTHQFRVALTQDPDERHFVLTISNTGKALPEHLDLEHPSTLGLQLISALVSQIHGTLTVERRPQPVFSIRFPV